MRRRLTALLCAVLLTIQMGSPSARAAEVVYFTVVNEVVQELNDATMPFWANGYLYVAGTMFAPKELGTGYLYNSMKKLAVVYSLETPSYVLSFDLSKNTVEDGDGNGYAPAGILKNGVIFLPVSMVAKFFGLTYTSSKVSGGSGSYSGYVIRVCSDSAVLSDRVFLDAAPPKLAQRYSEYQEAKEAASAAQTPPPENVSTPPVETAGRQAVYLCFRTGEQAGTEALLEALDAQDAFGTFYMTAEEIAASGDLTRRIAATGHSLGLVADASADLPVAEQLRRGNEALWQTAGVKTRLCVLENAAAEDRAAEEEGGYCVLAADIDRSAAGLRSAAGAGSLFTRVSARRGAVTVWLADQANAAGLRAFLRQAADADDWVAGLRETA